MLRFNDTQWPESYLKEKESNAVLPKELYAVECPSSGIRSVRKMYGFPIIANQFQVLQSEQQAASSRSTEQKEEGLIDPRTTRQRRWAAQGTEEKKAKAEQTTIHYRTAQGNSSSDNLVNPVAIDYTSHIVNSFSADPSVNFAKQTVGSTVSCLLGTGESVVGDEDLYDSLNCNKRISCAGPERSAGRPGHTPIRRTFACEKLVEDSCAGPDWSAGRPGTMPLGASSAACPSSQTACIGPYGTAATQQLYTGHNTRTEQFVTQSSSTRVPRQQRSSTSQYSASSSRRNAAEENASPAKVALHPRRPPYFVGGIDDDVYVWTSIVDRWLDTVQGEPSQQLTFIVSLLRGAAYEWYMHYETRTGCPGDWTTLRRALLERFGTSIRAEKARAGIYQLKQGKMSVLHYADAFESFLAQIDDYDEDQYLVHFIFGLRPEISRLVYIQQPASILAARNVAEKLIRWLWPLGRVWAPAIMPLTLLYFVWSCPWVFELTLH